MGQPATKVDELLTQIEALTPAERATLLGRALVLSRARPDWCVLNEIQIGVPLGMALASMPCPNVATNCVRPLDPGRR